MYIINNYNRYFYIISALLTVRHVAICFKISQFPFKKTCHSRPCDPVGTAKISGCPLSKLEESTPFVNFTYRQQVLVHHIIRILR